MGHIKKKRGTDYYWFSVSRDKWEFPVGEIYDNLTDYANAIGKDERGINQTVCQAERRGGFSVYRRVKK